MLDSINRDVEDMTRRCVGRVTKLSYQCYQRKSRDTPATSCGKRAAYASSMYKRPSSPTVGAARAITERPLTVKTVITLVTMLETTSCQSPQSRLRNQHRQHHNRLSISTRRMIYMSLACCRIAFAAVVSSTMTMEHGRRRRCEQQDDSIEPGHHVRTHRPHYTPSEAPQSSTHLPLRLQCLHSTVLRSLQPGRRGAPRQQ